MKKIRDVIKENLSLFNDTYFNPLEDFVYTEDELKSAWEHGFAGKSFEEFLGRIKNEK